MFGVGGGVIMVPYMVTFLDKTQHVAEGTSLMVIVPTAIAGVIAHNKRGYVSFSAGWRHRRVRGGRSVPRERD